MVDLLRSHPLLLTLPTLQSLRPIVDNPKSMTACCGKSVDLSGYRQAFEQGLRGMSADHKERMKQILGVSKIQYFAKSNGHLERKEF